MSTQTAGKWVELRVDGISCNNCAESIRSFLSRSDKDIQAIWINTTEGKVFILLKRLDGTKITSIKQKIEQLGYRVRQTDYTPFWKRKSLHLLVDGAIALVFLVSMIPFIDITIPIHVQLILSTIVLVSGFTTMGLRALQSVISARPSMEVLIMLGAISAYIYSVLQMLVYNNPEHVYFETTVLIITLVLFGFWLENKVLHRSEEALFTLIRKLQAPVKKITDGGKVKEVSPYELIPQDKIAIGEGTELPVDGILREGTVEVDESVLTGESMPVLRQPGDMIRAGSRVVSGTGIVEVVNTGESSSLAQVLRIISEVRNSPSRIRRIADRISNWFVPAVVIIALLTGFINYMAGIEAGESLMRAIAVLVIACPCAFGIAAPIALAAGAFVGSRMGIFVKNARVFESIKKVKKVFFDKTGTLTLPELDVSNIHSTLPAEDIKSLIVGLEKHSNHPVARAFVKEWKDANPHRFKFIKEIPGKGMVGITEEGIEVRLEADSSNGVNELPGLVLKRGGTKIAYIRLKEKLRPGAKEIISWLRKEKKLQVAMITGDKKTKADQIARELGIEEVYAECSPQDKLKILEEAERQNVTAMIGDGINDAAALLKATVSFSLGGATDVARNASHIVVSGDNLLRIKTAWLLAEKVHSIILSNFLWALVYNVIAIPIAALGLLTPSVAALSMAVSDVLLLLNTSRIYIWAERFRSTDVK